MLERGQLQWKNSQESFKPELLAGLNTCLQAGLVGEGTGDSNYINYSMRAQISQEG